MSWKAPLVVLWAVLIAGTTVASENYRLCEMTSHASFKNGAEFEAHTELFRSHEDLKLQNDEVEVLIVEEVSETN